MAAKKKTETKGETKAQTKPTGAAKSAAAPAPAASATPAKKSAPKPQAGSSGTPMIDTNVAANAAAAMVAGKRPTTSGGQQGQPQQPKKESGMFKQLKAGLNKPSAGALGGAFANTGPQKKSPLPFGGPQQGGQHAQTRSDATRTGVPRRTPG